MIDSLVRKFLSKLAERGVKKQAFRTEFWWPTFAFDALSFARYLQSCEMRLLRGVFVSPPTNKFTFRPKY
jgi:hypothetical protein